MGPISPQSAVSEDVRAATDGQGAASKPAPAGLSWRGMFFTGLLLWIASVAATALTSNTNLIPTVILLGSFLVPTTAVIWYVDHYHSPELSGALVVRAFIFGGVLGVIAAALVESILIPSAGWTMFFAVGLIEEGAKLLALMIIARGLGTRTIRDGIVLGAAVGFGFAALESSGYAFNALVVIENGRPVGLSLSDLVFAELLRGVLSPLGHGLWTGVLGGVLFAELPHGGWRPTPRLIVAYLFVSVLHGLFDSTAGIAEAIASISGAPPILVGIGVIFVVSVAALVVLVRLWRSERAPRPSPQLIR
jgi:RsiW-degrading membrane proteinase PrsW (M82 family)